MTGRELSSEMRANRGAQSKDRSDVQRFYQEASDYL
jgi:hypothetical protein